MMSTTDEMKQTEAYQTPKSSRHATSDLIHASCISTRAWRSHKGDVVLRIKRDRRGTFRDVRANESLNLKIDICKSHLSRARQSQTIGQETTPDLKRRPVRCMIPRGEPISAMPCGLQRLTAPLNEHEDFDDRLYRESRECDRLSWTRFGLGLRSAAWLAP